MSCGRIALDRAGIKYDKYFASEIDKFAIKVSTHNYPDTQHLGDVTQVRGEDLPEIELLIGGSPCQGFSFAGRGLNFDDPRSRLFFEFVRLKNELNPRYFMLENVPMKRQHQMGHGDLAAEKLPKNKPVSPMRCGNSSASLAIHGNALSSAPASLATDERWAASDASNAAVLPAIALRGAEANHG